MNAMMEYSTVRDRRRLAWVMLLGSFVICLGITISVPLTVNALLQNAKRPLDVAVQANQGTVGIDDETGLRRAVLVGQPVQSLSPGSRILTDSTATAVLLFSPPDDENLLARLQIYRNTSLGLERSDTPRYRVSDAGHQLELALERGRLRMVLPEPTGRPLSIRVTTPQGEVTISQPGQYLLTVNNAVTQVTVQAGEAVAFASGQSLKLIADQRAEIPTGEHPRGPLAIERNLIQNGDFSDSFAGWALFAWNVERPGQPEGTAEVVAMAGDSALRIQRKGEGHADTGVRQVINQDVTDFKSLRLEVDLRIAGQDLGVCGSLGSECPLTIRVEYEDVNGNNLAWQQGFFAVGESGLPETPDVCVSCPPPRLEHHKVGLGQFSFYQADLILDVQQQGVLPPSRIKSVSLIASGHSFEVEVLNLSLIAGELSEQE